VPALPPPQSAAASSRRRNGVERWRLTQASRSLSVMKA
jgi:hypothetical protein